MKIVGVGLNKTGTTTLGTCLRHWGKNHVGFCKEGFEHWVNHEYDDLFRIVDTHDSFEDWPWSMVYKEIDVRHPHSKFILTRRKNPQVWFKSLCKHAERKGPSDRRLKIYGHDMPHHHEAEHVDFYNRHLHTIRSYFAERPLDLLEVCWEEGDGWSELASFLDLSAPNIPFPHANRRPTALRKVVRGIRRRARPLLRPSSTTT